MLKVDRHAVLAFRARASHLDQRLDPESFDRAVFGGLQDSAPRAAVISLHARARSVNPSSWKHPALCQIWGPRGADYVIPRRDLAIFTVGRMPRDPDVAAWLERITDDVHAQCRGEACPTRKVTSALPALGHSIRATAITGRVLIRWDASRIWVIPVERPDSDPEDARLELARRFLGWFGPTTKKVFAWWSGVDRHDADLTWDALGREMSEVELDGRTRFVLSVDEEDLMGAGSMKAVRLIPQGDPYIKTDAELVVPDAERRLEIFPRSGKKTKFWPVAGAIVADNEIIGSWARQQRRVTLNPWRTLDASLREEIELEAMTFPIASRSEAQVRWVAVDRGIRT